MNVARRAVLTGAIAFSLLALSGCTLINGVDLQRQTGGNAALFGQFRAFDGHTGREVSFERLAARANEVDVVLFGEEHSDVVCNAIEAQLLADLARRWRPMTLAMEFFEADTQGSLDAYLNGRIDEAEFRKATRQKKAYLTAHRPMIEYCRAASVPVVAANAPMRLTRALRLSGQPFEKFRAGLDAADRAWLPRSSELLTGPYYDRFVKAMADHEMPTSQPTPLRGAPSSRPASQPASQPASSPHAGPPTSQPDRAEQLLRSYRAQSMWDDAMAESVANHRRHHANRRVMLIIGMFHIASDGGTKTKFLRLRPHDSVLTVVYQGVPNLPTTLEKDDHGAGDVVIYGIKPPEADSSGKTGPTSAPSSQPSHPSKK